MNDITENDVVSFISDSADIIAKMQARQISTAFVSAQNAGSLTNNVEFWKWLSKNYNCLSDAQAIQSIANGTVNQQQWLQRTVLQGKGYEWDFMTAQRDSIKNFFICIIYSRNLMPEHRQPNRDMILLKPKSSAEKS